MFGYKLKLIKKGKEKQPPEPSEEFKSAIRHTSSISIDCELCGRHHFGNYESELIEDLGEKGYKKLLKNSKKFPDKYVYHPDEDYIPWGTINGLQAVVDCQCNKLSQYENLFWNSQHIIANFISAVTNKRLKFAQDNKNLADKLKDSVK